MDYRTIVGIRRDPTGTLGIIADDVSGLTDRASCGSRSATGQNGSANVQEMSLWLQDTWQAAPRLTIAAGPALGIQPAAALLGPDPFLDYRHAIASSRAGSRCGSASLRNFAPRLGVAWQLTRDGRTVLRAGGGLYYDSSMSIADRRPERRPAEYHQPDQLDPLAGVVAAELRLHAGPAAAVRGAVESVARAGASARTSVVSLGYVGSSARQSHPARGRRRGQHLHRARRAHDQPRRVGLPRLAGAVPPAHVARTCRRWRSYTWSHSIDNDSSDSFLLWAGAGSERPRLVGFRPAARLHGVRDLRAGRACTGWAIDAIFRARTGFPITVLQSEQYQGITLMNAFRPDLVYGQPLWLSSPGDPGGRRLNPGSVRGDRRRPCRARSGATPSPGFGMSQVDLAVRREFRFSEQRRLLLRIEAFNALNHPNFGDPVALHEQPGFRAIHLDAEYDARDRQPRQRPRPDSADAAARDRCRARSASSFSR